MADQPQLILCGCPRPSDIPRRWRGLPRTTLEIGDGEDVHLLVEQLTAKMKAGVPDVSMDLLEVAAYVFAADQALTRGGVVEIDYGDAWRRKLRFVIPVRCPELWRRPEVQLALIAALEFLTDDEYEFEFCTATNPARADRYLFDSVAPAGTEFKAVHLFSGGADSLCGAVEEVLVKHRRVILVSHRSSTRVFARQKALFEAIRQEVTRPRSMPLHVAVTLNKGADLNRDFNQRSRSFVFASFAAVVARQVGLNEIRFFENGCTSLNLPVSPELIGARASRTTHPQSLSLIGDLFSLLFETTFQVTNPYQLCTKPDMFRRLDKRGYAALCALTCSCGTVWGVEEARPHCGRCSQCVERRISALAAGFTDLDDPPGRYESDPLEGERDGPELTFAERYVGSAKEVENIESARAFAIRYPEVNAAIPYLDGTADEAAESIYRLSRSNAVDVCQTIRTALAGSADRLFQQQIPARSLIGVALGRSFGPRREPAETQRPTAEAGFVVDPERFEVRLAGLPCFLGNTLEFRLVELLNATRNYVPVQRIAEVVWEDEQARRNSIQRVVSSIRRQFRNNGLGEVLIDGEQDGYYRLIVPDP